MQIYRQSVEYMMVNSCFTITVGLAKIFGPDQGGCLKYCLGKNRKLEHYKKSSLLENFYLVVHATLPFRLDIFSIF